MEPQDAALPAHLRAQRRRAAREMVANLAAVTGRLWRWLALLVGVLALLAAIEPSVGWMGKAVIDALQAHDADLVAAMRQHGLSFVLLFLAITVLRLAEKVANRIVLSRLVIDLQRTYLDRRAHEEHARDVAQVLYGTEIAKKGFEVLYKDIWVIGLKTISIAAWQITLAPEWLPVMLLATLPGFLVVWAFGRSIRRTSHDILGLQAQVAGSTARTQRSLFVQIQERLFRRFIWFEFVKASADEMMDLAIWTSAITLISLVYWLDLGLLPTRVEPGDLALVAINLNLLSQPLGHIGKTYTKWQEAMPALSQIFQLRRDADRR
jgi:ABC-type multidrug transport system fused ATPase/permease subunit